MARLRDLPIPTPFDLPAFVDIVAARRGRPIVLRAWETLTPSLSGICFSWPTHDLICYVVGTSPAHQQHVILHELAHLLCGHEGLSQGERAALLFPDLAPRLLERRRETYTTEDEREAETLASLILERVGRTQAHALSNDQHTTNVLRFLDSLEGTALD